MKIIGKIADESTRESFIQSVKAMPYTSICKECGTIFCFDQEEVIQKLTAHICCPACGNEYQIQAKYYKPEQKVKSKSGCSCASRTDEYNGWKCSVTDGACMFLYPNSKACAEIYGEGPDASSTPSLSEVSITLVSKYALKTCKYVSAINNMIQDLRDKFNSLKEEYQYNDDIIKFMKFLFNSILDDIIIDNIIYRDDKKEEYKGFVTDLDLSKIEDLEYLSNELKFEYLIIDEEITQDESLYGSYIVRFEEDSIISQIVNQYKKDYGLLDNKEEES